MGSFLLKELLCSRRKLDSGIFVWKTSFDVTRAVGVLDDRLNPAEQLPETLLLLREANGSRRSHARVPAAIGTRLGTRVLRALGILRLRLWSFGVARAPGEGDRPAFSALGWLRFACPNASSSGAGQIRLKGTRSPLVLLVRLLDHLPLVLVLLPDGAESPWKDPEHVPPFCLSGIN